MRLERLLENAMTYSEAITMPHNYLKITGNLDDQQKEMVFFDANLRITDRERRYRVESIEFCDYDEAFPLDKKDLMNVVDNTKLISKAQIMVRDTYRNEYKKMLTMRRVPGGILHVKRKGPVYKPARFVRNIGICSNGSPDDEIKDSLIAEGADYLEETKKALFDFDMTIDDNCGRIEITNMIRVYAPNYIKRLSLGPSADSGNQNYELLRSNAIINSFRFSEKLDNIRYHVSAGVMPDWFGRNFRNQDVIFPNPDFNYIMMQTD